MCKSRGYKHIKSFKDNLARLSAWKNSDQVNRTAFKNPKPPKIEVVCKAVSQTRKKVETGVILNSVRVTVKKYLLKHTYVKDLNLLIISLTSYNKLRSCD